MNDWIDVQYDMPPKGEHGDPNPEVLITVYDHETGRSDVYKGFYQDGSWWTQYVHGCKRIEDNLDGENLEVTGWMPLPEPFKRHIWFAVQKTREGSWDNGSHKFKEASNMLKEQGYGLIAVINEDTNYCVREIEYDDLKKWGWKDEEL